MIHPRHIKQSQLFITIHATAKNTKNKAKQNIKGEYHNTMLLYAKTTHDSFKAH